MARNYRPGCEHAGAHVVIGGGHNLLLDACLGQGLAQLLHLHLLVPQPALQLYRPPLKCEGESSPAACMSCMSLSYRAGAHCPPALQVHRPPLNDNGAIHLARPHILQDFLWYSRRITLPNIRAVYAADDIMTCTSLAVESALCCSLASPWPNCMEQHKANCTAVLGVGIGMYLPAAGCSGTGRCSSAPPGWPARAGSAPSH